MKGAGHGLFTAAAPWYADISGAALDPESDRVLAGLAARGGWGTGSLRIDFSIEVLRARRRDPAPQPFTPRPATSTLRTATTCRCRCRRAGSSRARRGYACTSDGDCHLIVVTSAHQELYEMWRANITRSSDLQRRLPRGVGSHPATTGPRPRCRGDQCTSADAAGFPIAPLLFTADEVAAGEIDARDPLHPAEQSHPQGRLRPPRDARRRDRGGAQPTRRPTASASACEPTSSRLAAERRRAGRRARDAEVRHVPRRRRQHRAHRAQPTRTTHGEVDGPARRRAIWRAQGQDFEVVDGGSRSRSPSTASAPASEPVANLWARRSPARGR